MQELCFAPWVRLPKSTAPSYNTDIVHDPSKSFEIPRGGFIVKFLGVIDEVFSVGNCIIHIAGVIHIVE